MVQWTNQLRFWWEVALLPREEEMIRLREKKIDPGEWLECVGPKSGPNNKTWEKKKWVAITNTRWQIGMSYPLDLNRKSYMGSPMTPSHLTLSDIEWPGKVKFKLLRFWSQIIGAELGHMLALHINRKPYMGITIAPSHLTLSDTERLQSRSLRF